VQKEVAGLQAQVERQTQLLEQLLEQTKPKLV
jgi:hypothetical protein